MAASLKCLIWAFLICIGPTCFAYDMTVRILDEGNRKPLKHVPVVVSFHYDKQKDPAVHKALWELTTGANGEVNLPLPVPAPEDIEVSVDLSQNKWDCSCHALVSTYALIQHGTVEGPDKRDLQPPPVKAAPGEIVFVAHRLAPWVQLFRPLYKD